MDMFTAQTPRSSRARSLSTGGWANPPQSSLPGFRELGGLLLLRVLRHSVDAAQTTVQIAAIAPKPAAAALQSEAILFNLEASLRATWRRDSIRQCKAAALIGDPGHLAVACTTTISLVPASAIRDIAVPARRTVTTLASLPWRRSSVISHTVGSK